MSTPNRGAYEVGKVVDGPFRRRVLGERGRAVLTLGRGTVRAHLGLVGHEEDRNERDVRDEDDEGRPVACVAGGRPSANCQSESKVLGDGLRTDRGWPTRRQRSSSWRGSPTGRRSRRHPARQRSAPTFAQTCGTGRRVMESITCSRETLYRPIARLEAPCRGESGGDDLTVES